MDSFDDFKKRFHDTSHDFGLAAYFGISVIIIVTALLILVEVLKRKTISQLEKGYYFVEVMSWRRNRLVAVPPENVDASNPQCPRIINPALIGLDMCSCCT